MLLFPFLNRFFYFVVFFSWKTTGSGTMLRYVMRHTVLFVSITIRKKKYVTLDCNFYFSFYFIVRSTAHRVIFASFLFPLLLSTFVLIIIICLSCRREIDHFCWNMIFFSRNTFCELFSHRCHVQHGWESFRIRPNLAVGVVAVYVVVIRLLWLN